MEIQSPKFQEIETALKPYRRDKLSPERIAELKARRKELQAQFKKQKNIFLNGGEEESSSNKEQNSTYKLISAEFGESIPSETLSSLNQMIVSKYRCHKSEIANGDRTISNYKKGMPVPFPIKNNGKLRLRRRDDGCIYLCFPKGPEWDLQFGRDRSNNREIAERVLNGIYSAQTSSLQAKNNKVFLLLVVDTGKAATHEFVPDRVVGIDVGINIPIYAATNDSISGQPIGSRDKFLDVRKRMAAQHRELQHSLTTSTGNGHGRTHKLQALKRFKEKERNWVHTQNHIFSREVINYALKMKAGVIHMEKLSGFGRDKSGNIDPDRKFLLRNWSYYELQHLIEEKADREGIIVEYIDPYHTSQICSFCGHYEEGQRLEQSVFICKNPDCDEKGKRNKDGSFTGINADWNAARNIAKRDINYCREQEK